MLFVCTFAPKNPVHKTSSCLQGFHFTNNFQKNALLRTIRFVDCKQ